MKSTLEILKERHPEMKMWMEAMHRQPELSMNEEKTSAYIAETLKSFGAFEVSEGIGQYGIVASLKVGNSNKSIGIRADFDALPIQEDNDLPYKSELAGKSHLCGHDGHTTMLLAAAKYLAETQNFDGTVRLIFQPGEETMQGGPAMIADGLFEKFPVDAVYAMHNIPGLPVGKFHFREGPTMSAVDNWEIELTGKGGHGSMPELAVDPLVCGAAVVMALQTIVSRNVSPWKQTVVNVGSFQSGNAGNVVPQNAVLKLSIRNMDNEVRKMVLDKIRSITRAQAESFGCTWEIREGIPGTVLVNTAKETEWAATVAEEVFGSENVIRNTEPMMSSEDFAFMLEQRPGSYCMLGNGEGFMVHHPKYVFNQDILPVGAAYWVSLVENYLKPD
ncbi:M20 aminoacylase family protein [Chryseobacterium sp. MFBS3-17]|uniref:M20 aminoacylase family protein n=1 Tax=Chryseobacterium sp. MFBS3-17 TaxID=2886689 RepID=UPI001D0E239F|nr:M20 aminoacylase family protein [Chryseobacterium sp. MFBS3-17]MCC2590247.1 M20 family metallopeptidase [Chryseobacterium sp. MFBS3-17]